MLGAILSRAIIGVSPFFPTVVAAFVLAVIHRLLARSSLYHEWLGRLVKGRKMSLYKEGKLNWPNMKRCVISEGPMESVRLAIKDRSLEKVDEILMEQSGEISVIVKKIICREKH